MKRLLLLVPFLISFISCEYHPKGETIYKNNTVINNSDYDVILNANNDYYTVLSGETKICSVKMKRGYMDTVYLTVTDYSYPRVSLSRQPNGNFTFTYTIENSTPKKIDVYNSSSYDIIIYDNYLGLTYNENGVKILAGQKVSLDFYKTPSISAVYSNNSEYPDGLQANVILYKDYYVVN